MQKRGRTVTRPLVYPEYENYNKDITMITSETEISSCIDWLSVTRPKSDYPDNYPKKYKELKHGQMGYDVAIQFIDGRIELCSSTRDEMGVHTILSGETILRLCELAGVNSFDIVASIGATGCSRIDLAVDIKHGTLDIEKLFNMLENDEVETTKTSWLFLRGAKGGGATLYVGAPKSEKRLRIYDKQAESGTEYAWTRVEMQYRHKSAKRAVSALLSSKSPQADVAKIINSFINFEKDADWVVSLGSDSIKLGKPEPSNSDRRNWLLETAASALASEMIEGSGGREFLSKFIESTLEKYGAKRDEYKGDET